MSITTTPKKLVRDILPKGRKTNELLKENEVSPVLIRLETPKGSLGYMPLNAPLPSYEGIKPARVGKQLDYFGKSNKKKITTGG